MSEVAGWAANMRPRMVQMRRPKSQRRRDEREGGIRTEPTAWAPSCQRWRCELAGGWREWCGGRCEVCARHPLLLEQELNTPPLRFDVPCVRASLKTCGCAEPAFRVRDRRGTAAFASSAYSSPRYYRLSPPSPEGRGGQGVRTT